MSINATIDGTVYENVSSISVAGKTATKTITLSEVASGSAGSEVASGTWTGDGTRNITVNIGEGKKIFYLHNVTMMDADLTDKPYGAYKMTSVFVDIENLFAFVGGTNYAGTGVGCDFRKGNSSFSISYSNGILEIKNMIIGDGGATSVNGTEYTWEAY